MARGGAMAERATLVAGVDPVADIQEELTRLEQVYPAWQTWIGAAGYFVHARRLDPSLDVRAGDTATLWERVRQAEQGKLF
jgi:hypothetical protein